MSLVLLPDPQAGQPVGTLHAAVAGPGQLSVKSFTLAGDRDGIRAGAVEAGLQLLRDSLAESE
jgi:nicotinamide-nucleotide amidase